MQNTSLVELVLARLAVRYGVLWSRMWEDIDPGAVKADWAAELAGLSAGAVHYALRYLPHDRPPTAAAFRAICQRAPLPQFQRLSAPRALPPAGLKDWKPGFSGDPLDGARSLRRREQRGERLSPFQRSFWRRALARELAAEREAPTP